MRVVQLGVNNVLVVSMREYSVRSNYGVLYRGRPRQGMGSGTLPGRRLPIQGRRARLGSHRVRARPRSDQRVRGSAPEVPVGLASAPATAGAGGRMRDRSTSTLTAGSRPENSRFEFCGLGRRWLHCGGEFSNCCRC